MDFPLNSFTFSELLSVVKKSNVSTKGRLKKAEVIELINFNQEATREELLKLRRRKHRSILDDYLHKGEVEPYKEYYLLELYKDNEDLFNALYKRNKELFDWLLKTKLQIARPREAIYIIIKEDLVEYAKSLAPYITQKDMKDFFENCIDLDLPMNESRRILC